MLDGAHIQWCPIEEEEEGEVEAADKVEVTNQTR
jgi:hypothetical protein